MYTIVRRPLYSAFSPTDVANLFAWYKADAITGLNNNDTIASWSDSSGNSRTLTQSTEAQKPTYKTNIKNSLPIVRFDGTADWMKSSAQTITANRTVFVVSTNGSANNSDVFIVQDNGGAHSGELRIDTSQLTTRVEVLSPNATKEGTKSLSAGWSIFTMRISDNDDNITAYVNAVAGTATSLAGGTPKTGSNYLITVGQFGLGFQYFGGDVAEIVHYERDLTSTEISNVHSYLNNKWAVY